MQHRDPFDGPAAEQRVVTLALGILRPRQTNELQSEGVVHPDGPGDFGGGVPAAAVTATVIQLIAEGDVHIPGLRAFPKESRRFRRETPQLSLIHI